MKKNIIVISVYLLIGIVPVQPALSQQTLNFITLDKFEPFTWKKNNQAKGIDVDILIDLCNRINVKCNISFMPWKRVIHYTKTGKMDGAFAAFKTQERESFAHYLELPFHYSKYNIFVNKGHEFPFKKIQDLYGKRLGKNRGFNLGKELTQAAREKKIPIEEAGDAKANILKLIGKRIEGYVCNYHEALVMIKQLGYSGQVVPLDKPIRKSRGAFLMISKAAKIENKDKLIQEMNRALKTMHDDGTVEKIISSYLE